jgi:hypothetical protein
VSQALGETWVSPCRISTSSNGTPSWSATIWLNAVSCPWPCAVDAGDDLDLAGGSIRIAACSQPPGAVASEPSSRDGREAAHLGERRDADADWTGSPSARRSSCSRRSPS